MKLTLSKQRFVFIGVLFFILLIGGVYLLMNSSKFEFMSKKVDKYDKLIDFCEIKKQTRENLYFDCYAFLESESTDEEGVNCITFVTPYFDEEGTRLDMQICEEEEKIVWENPYSNYSLHIPVVITFKYKKSSFRFYEFEDLSIELMEDEKAFELWELVDLLGPMHYKAFRSSGHKLTEELGYIITGEEDPNDVESFVPSGLVIHSVRIKSYEVEGSQISLQIEAFINEEERTFSLFTEQFNLFKGAPEQEGESVLIDSSNIAENINTGIQYGMYFKFKDKSLISQDFVDKQLDLLVEGEESDLLFDTITVIYEE